MCVVALTLLSGTLPIASTVSTHPPLLPSIHTVRARAVKQEGETLEETAEKARAEVAKTPPLAFPVGLLMPSGTALMSNVLAMPVAAALHATTFQPAEHNNDNGGGDGGDSDHSESTGPLEDEGQEQAAKLQLERAENSQLREQGVGDDCYDTLREVNKEATMRSSSQS